MRHREEEQPVSVADHRLGKTRVLSRQCGTCIFRPGNPMHLDPGRLSAMIRQAQARERYIICHDTLPQVHPGYGPAVCRGFYNRYDTWALQLARRLWGIVEVPPPPATPGQTAPTGTVPAGPGTVPPEPRPATAPFVFVDVDGVLNPAGANPRTRGYRPHPFAHTGSGGSVTGAVVWLHPDHGAWLAELETAGARLVWATSWNHLANTWIAPRPGLPGTWPVVDLHGRGGVRWGHALKLDPIAAYACDTPFVLLDDQIGGKDHDWAAQRTSRGAPTLLAAVDPHAGLTRATIDRVLGWLADPAQPTTDPHTLARGHDCLAAGTLEFVAAYGAPGVGQAWQCTGCGRGWARLGDHFHPAAEQVHILSPEDTR